MTKQKEYISKCCSYLYKEKQSRGDDPVNVLTWVCSKCNKECELVENVDIDHKKTVHVTDKGVYVNGVKQEPLLEDWKSKIDEMLTVLIYGVRNPETKWEVNDKRKTDIKAFITQLLEEKGVRDIIKWAVDSGSYIDRASMTRHEAAECVEKTTARIYQKYLTNPNNEE